MPRFNAPSLIKLTDKHHPPLFLLVMNQLKATQKLSEEELKYTPSSIEHSWHYDYIVCSAIIYIGSLPYDMNEGDLLVMFSQFGDVEWVELKRHEETGKSLGYAFLKYENALSTALAVDNFNGVLLGNRQIRVDHVKEYRGEAKTKEEVAVGVDYRQSGKVPETKAAPDLEETEEVDPFLKAKLEKERKEDRRERIRNQIAKELNIPEDDPMREYLISKELKRRRKQ